MEPVSAIIALGAISGAIGLYKVFTNKRPTEKIDLKNGNHKPKNVQINDGVKTKQKDRFLRL